MIQTPEDRVCPTSTGHGHDRRFPTCVTTPSTDNLDDAATTEVSQSQQLVRKDLPEMGQRQDQTEKIQKTVAKTQGQIAETFTDHPEDPEVCRGTTSCSTTDPARSEPRGPDKTQRGQSPEGQTRPSEFRALRAKQDPAWSEP